MSVKGMWRRFERCMDEGEYYDAEQACRSAYFRAVSGAGKKSTQGDVVGARDEAYEFLSEAVQRMVSAGQIHSATSLALDAVKHLRDYPSDTTTTKIEALTRTLGSFSNALNDSTVAASELIRADELYSNQLRALAALIEVDMQNGSACFNELEKLSGVAQWRLSRYADAQDHLVRCVSVSSALLGTMLAEWCSVRGAGVRSERGLFLARAVLMILAHEKSRSIAADEISAYVSTLHAAFCAHLGHPTPETSSLTGVHAPEECALERFVFLLCVAVRSRNYNLFRLLSSAYKPSLSRDPRLERYLAPISRVWFGVEPPRAAGAGGPNMFGSLMSNMMRGMMRPSGGGTRMDTVG